MSTRVLVIGLDAAEATLLERWADDGDLPSLARIRAGGATVRLANCMETLPGAIWPEIHTGRSCGRVPLYYHPAQLRTGEARVRRIQADEVDAEDFFWTAAARAGARVAVIDPVQAVAARGVDGVQLFEWGLHDRTFGVSAEPAQALDELRACEGAYPVQVCDRHGGRRGEYEGLLAALVEGVAAKTALSERLLRRERWNLFFTTFGESHCAGHQFWHFFDPYRTGRDDPDPPAHLRDAIRTVYRAIDAGIGRLVEAAGAGCAVFVVTSHGMGRYTAGPHLLPEILARLGMGSASGAARGAAGPLRRMQVLASHAPRALQPGLRWLAQTGVARRLQEPAGCLLDPLTSPRTRAVALKNNRCGAIRFNVVGREPHGSVRPGAEAEALGAEIRRELEALTHPVSGERVVRRVVSAGEAFGAAHHPDVPDLMVVFRTDLGVLETVRSPRVGLLRVPNYHPNIPRSGDHTVESRLWAAGDGVPGASAVRDASVLDVAPTVLAALGLAASARVDGRPIEWSGR